MDVYKIDSNELLGEVNKKFPEIITLEDAMRHMLYMDYEMEELRIEYNKLWQRYARALK